MMHRYPRIIFSTFFFISIFFVSLAGAEHLYHLFEPPRQAINARGFFASSLEYDPMLGWKNTPSTHNIFDTKKFTIDVITNAEGMRDEEVGIKSPDKKRIAVIGDSMVWGWGVQAEERFTDLLEKELSVEMLNFGVTGYSPLQYYLSLDRVLSFKPDAVLLTFTLYNDFDNVASTVLATGSYVPYAALKEEKLVIKGYPIPNIQEYNPKRANVLGVFITQYALGRLLYVTLEQNAPTLFKHILLSPVPERPKREGLLEFDRSKLYTAPKDPDIKKATAINKAILAAMKQKLDEHCIPLMILAARTHEDLNANALNILKEQARELNIPLVHDTPAVNMREFSNSPKDGHWNPAGHKRAAKILTEPLRLFLAAPTCKKPYTH
jgi:lysophospholipase L1-like esterase